MRDWKRELRRRLAPLRLPPGREAEIVEELSQHCEHAAPDDAELDALVRELATLERRAAEPIEAGAAGGGAIARTLQDVRYGIRALRKRPGFTLVATLTLALGIGAVTALFSAVRGVLLRPLPYEHPEQLAAFWLTAPEKGLPVVALPDGLFIWYREHSRAFTEMAAYNSGDVILGGAGDPERLAASAVSHELFHVMGVKPLLGRVFVAAEETAQPGGGPVTVISYGLWQRHLAATRR